MKYFFDTEFIEDGKTIELISIGVVAEDGRELYCISSEFDDLNANDWVRENVLSKLPHPWRRADAPVWFTREAIKNQVLAFVGQDKPEFWGYFADYDWVVFCWLFGTMMNLPKDWPMYCRDIKQLCDDMGNPKLPDQENEHNALDDAKWNKAAYEFLKEIDNA